MANNKYAGYTPKKEETLPNKGVPGSGTKLDRVNPYEFRKGMDYELTSMGVTRLAESTPEEREKATEAVLKNLDEHQAYYSALIHFEGGMNLGSKITESSFKKWLENYMPGDVGTGMVEVNKEIKDDKMVELKEAINREIKNLLNEAKKDKDEPESDDVTDQKASKGAKGKEKALKALDKEIEKLEKEKDKNKEKLSGPLAR